jgi:hypothetical protein
MGERQGLASGVRPRALRFRVCGSGSQGLRSSARIGVAANNLIYL